jgi:hypothetical protein
MLRLATFRSGNRIPVRVRFFAPVQTGPGTHPSLLFNGYRVFPGGKERPGRDVDQSPHLRLKVKERLELHLNSASGPSWSVLGWPLPLTLPIFVSKFDRSNLWHFVWDILEFWGKMYEKVSILSEFVWRCYDLKNAYVEMKRTVDTYV